MRDFFALRGAAGVVAAVPAFGESSFSSVAASAGGAPLLFCFERRRHLAALPVWYEREGNGGRPIEGFYFLEHLRDFARAVAEDSPTTRTLLSRRRRPREPPDLCDSDYDYDYERCRNERGWPLQWDDVRVLQAAAVAAAAGAAEWPVVHLPCAFSGDQELHLEGGIPLRLRGIDFSAAATQPQARAALYGAVVGACEEAARLPPPPPLDSTGSAGSSLSSPRLPLQLNIQLLRMCESEEKVASFVHLLAGLQGGDQFCPPPKPASALETLRGG